MNPQSDDQVEAMRLQTEAHLKRVGEAKWVFQQQYGMLSKAYTEQQKVHISMKAMVVNGYTRAEIMEAIMSLEDEARVRG